MVYLPIQSLPWLQLLWEDKSYRHIHQCMSLPQCSTVTSIERSCPRFETAVTQWWSDTAAGASGREECRSRTDLVIATTYSENSRCSQSFCTSCLERHGRKPWTSSNSPPQYRAARANCDSRTCQVVGRRRQKDRVSCHLGSPTWHRHSHAPTSLRPFRYSLKNL